MKDYCQTCKDGEPSFHVCYNDELFQDLIKEIKDLNKRLDDHFTILDQIKTIHDDDMDEMKKALESLRP